MTKADGIRDDLARVEKALARLGEALAQNPPADQAMIYRDALIQRFEFSIELMWKFLKHLLEKEEIIARSPLAVFKEAYSLDWLGNDDTIWTAMIKDRNLCAHTYNESLAQEIAARIPAYYTRMHETLTALKGKA